MHEHKHRLMKKSLMWQSHWWVI